MNRKLIELVKTRCSTREFTGEHIDDETIQNILNIVAYTPSSWGGHTVEFMVIRDRKTMKALAQCKQMGAGPLAYGDAAIVPVIDQRNLGLWVEDAAVAPTFLLLAAEYYGVGACWIQTEDRRGHTGIAKEDIRELLNVPDCYGTLNAII